MTNSETTIAWTTMAWRLRALVLSGFSPSEEGKEVFVVEMSCGSAVVKPIVGV